MLSPEEDFETWVFLFKETCAPKGDYILLLPDFTRLISFYAENSKLPESLTDFTYEFINNTALSLLSSLFDLTFLSEEELVSVKDAIKLIINSSSIGIKNNVLSCDKLLLNCLQNNQPFYQKNHNSYKNLNTQYSYLYSEIFQFFLKEGPLQNLIDTVIAKPTIENFSLFASIFTNKLYLFQSGESSQFLEKIQDPFIIFFSQFDNANLRDADKKSLTDISKFLGQYITPEEVFSPLRDSFLNFGNLCLRSNYVDKNLIGSDILSKISTTFPDSFQKFAKDTQLIDFLLSNDIHETVLLQLSSVSSSLFKDEQPSIDQLNQIYTRAELSHPSQKEAINKFLVNILTTCKENTIEDFLKKLTDEKKLTLDLINFLQLFINEAATKNPEGVSYATRYILSLIDKDTDDFSMVKEAINKLSKCVMTVAFRQTIYDYLITKISSGPISDEQYHPIKQLIKSALITTGDEVKQLIEVCISNNQIKLIKSIAMNSYAKLPPSTLEKLTTNEGGWSILSKIIKKRGFSAFESSNEFSDVIKNLNIEEASMTQFLVVKEFLLTQGVESKKLTTYTQANSSIGSYFKVNDPRIDGTETILKFITITKDEKVNENALLFLLELYENSSVKYFNLFSEDIYKELHSEKIISISQSINNNSGDLLSIFPQDQQIVLSKLLKMVTAMINLAEKNSDTSDSPVKSHKHLHKNEITFSIRFGDEQKDVTVDSSIKGNELYDIVSKKFERKREYYTILTENGSTVRYSDSLSSTGVHDGSYLVVTNPEKYGKLEITEEKDRVLEIISANGTSEIYFNILKCCNLEKELKDEIWKFLMLMPSVSNITIDSLNNAKSQMEIRYIIQFFTKDKSERDDQIYTKVIDMICHDQIQLFGLSDALQLIRFHMNFTSEENARLFVDFLLNSLINEEMGKIKQLIIDMLITYSCRYQPFLTMQLLSDEKRFSDIVLKTPNPHFPRLSAIFSNLTNYPKAFSMLLSLMDKVINRTDIIDEYFKLLNSVFNDSCDFSAAINTCIRLIEQQKDQSSLNFVSCSFLSTIFSKKPSLITEYSNQLFEPLLKTVFLLSNTTQQETIIDLLLLFCKDNEKCKTEFFNALYNHFDSIKTDRWSYDPSMNTKSSTGYNGLRNMGATCYMNSVFQQLFFNNEFIHNLLKSRYQEECLIQLRALFIKMMKSIRGVVDTSGFVSNWKINNVPVNPREQQDACEFLLRLLDKLHDELYKGEQVSINEGENADYRSESIEPFCNLTLDVKDRSSFEDSINSFLQKISVTGYFAENLQKKINILRYFRIKKAPKFLIVQLNRFEYDIVTWRKVKINDKFVFPLEFDLAPLTEDSAEGEKNSNSNENKEKILYSLIGIINHCGTMEGGHYQSYIKRGSKWLNFNDSSVSEANEKTLLEEAYGTDKTTTTTSSYYEEDAFNRSSAYLLFYVRKEELESLNDESQSSFENDIDSNGYDLELLTEINKDNNEYTHMQSAFGTAMLNTVVNLNDIKLSTTYFLNVFTHSRDSALTTKFSDHFIELLSKSEENNRYDEIMEIFTEKTNDIFEAILHADSAVAKSIQDILSTILEHSTVEKCRAFASNMIQYIPSVISNWRCIHKFLEILMIYCNRDVEFIQKENIAQKLFVTIKSVLENTKSSVYLKNVNFSSFFVFVNDHIKENILDKENLTELCSLANIVIQSTEHGDSFMKIVKSCNELGLADMPAIVDKIISQSKEITPSIILSLSDQFISNNKATELFNNPRFSKSSFAYSLSSILNNNGPASSSSIRQKLIDNGIILFYLITCDDRKAAKKMEAVYLELFPDVPALNNYPRAESASNEYEKMTWKDQDASYVIKNDYNDMHNVLIAAIKGINEMNEKPSSFYYGDKLNKKFNQMIRVLVWLILRTQYQLNDDEMNIIFKFFEVMHQQSINNNIMMVEMCRLLRVLPRRELIIQQFDNLINYIFCSDYDSVYYRTIFIVFIESMKNDIISHPECFNKLLSNEGFEKSFSFACKSKKYVFDNFIQILDEVKPDISSLIKPNLSLLLKSHTEILLIALPYAKKINDENFFDNHSFEELVNSIYLLFIDVTSNDKLFIPENFDCLKASFDHLHNEFEKRKGNIFSLDENAEFINSIRECIPYSCSMCVDHSFELYNLMIAQFLIDTALSNSIFEDDIISNVLDNQKNKKGIMNLHVLSRLGDKNVRNDVGIELSTKKSLELNSFIIDLALYLIDKDGIQDWTRILINTICTSNENVIFMMPDLFAKISTLLNVSELEKIAELLNGCGNKDKMHAILEKIFEKRPEVKEQILAAANIEDDRF